MACLLRHPMPSGQSGRAAGGAGVTDGGTGGGASGRYLAKALPSCRRTVQQQQLRSHV